MLYVNCNFKVSTNLNLNAHHSVYGISMGWNYQKGHHQRFLAISRRDSGVLSAGFHPELTIGSTNSGKERIDAKNDERLYLLLTTRLTDDTGRVGKIYAPKRQASDILISTQTRNRQDRQLSWNELLIRAKVGDAFYITWQAPDSKMGRNCLYYVERPNLIRSCNQAGIMEKFRSWGIRQESLPFTMYRDEFGGSRLRMHEWQQLT